MNVFDDKLAALEAFEKNQDQIVMSIAKDFEAIIMDMNTFQLSEKGINSEGVEIASYQPYTTNTKRIKRSKGQPTDRVTLLDTEDFHNSWFIVFINDYFALGSDDPKALKLERKYGPEIYGLISENLQILIDLIRPELIQKLKAIL